MFFSSATVLFSWWRSLWLRWSLQRLYNGNFPPFHAAKKFITICLYLNWRDVIFGLFIWSIKVMPNNSRSKVKKLLFYAVCSASATQIWLVIVLIQSNSGRSFHGSSMLCHLLIVQRVVMGLTPIVWIWMVCKSDTHCLSLQVKSFLFSFFNYKLLQMHQPSWLAL